MKRFLSFLKENDDKLKHLTHLEDRVIDHGSEGYTHAVTHLYSVHDKLKGRTRDRSITSIKKDGAPAIIFGHHPETGKFFVGTKSVFNKTPKINYSDEDIEKNHGHAPGLVHKLKDALRFLPKITPHGKIYQGDMMYSRGDVKKEEGKYKFKPNTIEYSTPTSSPEGKKVARAKLGIAIHTEYKTPDGTFSSAKAHFNPDPKEFHSHPDVHVISHHYDFEDPQYEQHHHQDFVHSMKLAKGAHASMSEDDYKKTKDHSDHLNIYINQRVRESNSPGLDLSASGYQKFLKKRSEEHKSPSERKKALERYHDASNNHNSFNKVFAVHKHLTDAKEALIHVMNKRQTYGHSIGGIATNPEGYVDSISHKGRTIPSKFVLRQVFAKNNFATGKPGAAITEEKKSRGVVAVYGKVRIPTIGHKLLVDSAKEHAERNGMKLNVTLSGADHPLDKKTKKQHAEALFGHKVSIANKNSSNVINYLSNLHNRGHSELHLFAGSDRAAEYSSLLKRYNGKPDKSGHIPFAFKKWKVHSVGAERKDSRKHPTKMNRDELVSTVSATKLESLANSGDYPGFKAYHPDMPDRHVRSLYKRIREA